MSLYTRVLTADRRTHQANASTELAGSSRGAKLSLAPAGQKEPQLPFLFLLKAEGDTTASWFSSKAN